MNTLKIKGKIVYNPRRDKLKKTRTHDEFFLVLEVPDNVGVYYRHWLYRRFGIKISPPAYGCHVTVLDGRQPVKKEHIAAWKKHAGKVIEIEYTPEVYRQWLFWCLPVVSPELDEIRKELGFSTAKPLHITIGRMDDDLINLKWLN